MHKNAGAGGEFFLPGQIAQISGSAAFYFCLFFLLTKVDGYGIMEISPRAEGARPNRPLTKVKKL